MITITYDGVTVFQLSNEQADIIEGALCGEQTAQEWFSQGQINQLQLKIDASAKKLVKIAKQRKWFQNNGIESIPADDEKAATLVMGFPEYLAMRSEFWNEKIMVLQDNINVNQTRINEMQYKLDNEELTQSQRDELKADIATTQDTIAKDEALIADCEKRMGGRW